MKKNSYNSIIGLFFLFNLLVLKSQNIPYNIQYSDSLIVNDKKIKIQLTDKNVFYILSENDTIKEDDYYPSDITFFDFNEDGLIDIKISFLSNTPGFCDIYMYNKSIDFYHKVNGLNNIFEPQKLNGTEYYYSYSRNGCADENWISELFKIKDNNVIKIAQIQAIACESDNKKVGIYVFIYHDENLILYQMLKFSEIIPFENNKFKFIENYWLKNADKIMLQKK
jgi:hypothetical protein